MSAILEVLGRDSIFDRMENHPAWFGDISGLHAEKKLRGRKTPYLYLLRKGEPSVKENEQNYYVTFLLPDLSVKHQPLVITYALEGYFYENAQPGGPCNHEASIEDVLHLIMHCEVGQCVPFEK